jgi:uncharacterized Zn-binding protein involved in type VI secretion
LSDFLEAVLSAIKTKGPENPFSLQPASLTIAHGPARRDCPFTTNGKRKLRMPQHRKNERTYLFATIGSHAARGGRISRVSTEADAEGLALACVGDVVTYEDGTEARILDGAGAAALWNDAPLALVGSRLSKGDTIIETLQNFCGIAISEGEIVQGLFEPGYVPPPVTDSANGEDAYA